ncbi:hypothetical protein ACFQXA_23265 [Nocardiopsis composta]
MPTAALTAPAAETRAPAAAGPGEVDNRIAYTGFAFAYLAGHGSAALSAGPAPCSPSPAGCPWRCSARAWPSASPPPRSPPSAPSAARPGRTPSRATWPEPPG